MHCPFQPKKRAVSASHRGTPARCLAARDLYDSAHRNPDTYNQPMRFTLRDAPCEWCRRYRYRAQQRRPERHGLATAARPRTARTTADKLRRFNFLLYQTVTADALAERNPYVTVPSPLRGLRISPTVQRVNTRAWRRSSGRQIRDGEVLTAFQSACPTEASSFGAQRSNSRVARIREPAELRPAAELTLARHDLHGIVRNPNRSSRPRRRPKGSPLIATEHPHDRIAGITGASRCARRRGHAPGPTFGPSPTDHNIA